MLLPRLPLRHLLPRLLLLLLRRLLACLVLRLRLVLVLVEEVAALHRGLGQDEGDGEPEDRADLGGRVGADAPTEHAHLRGWGWGGDEVGG